ncbi:GH13000 [Drosophila grimshawi]|uniref:GH13000 n=1 Tax=Drosophila grimshawi TaxID=7222 RepID=B4JP60_DROGR|nr:GH13000 [Drosophila grimshawi]
MIDSGSLSEPLIDIHTTTPPLAAPRNSDQKENGSQFSPGIASPAAAAACTDCSSALECSCALRHSSDTKLERGSCESQPLPNTFCGGITDEDVYDDSTRGCGVNEQHELSLGNYNPYENAFQNFV